MRWVSNTYLVWCSHHYMYLIMLLGTNEDNILTGTIGTDQIVIDLQIKGSVASSSDFIKY